MKPQRREAGMGLVELMVATVLALLVVAGAASVYAGLKNSWQAQDDLAEMQDNERLAVLLLSQVVRLTGFNPDPLGTPSAAALPPEAMAGFGTLAAGQALVGTAGGADTLTVRFLADGNGIASDCTGSKAYPRGSLVTNRIRLDAGGNLTCKVNGNTTQPLLAGVAGFEVSYGVDTDPACAPCQPRQYMDASQVSAAAAWNRVRVLRLALRFTVPGGRPPTVQWEQNVAVMNP